MITVLTEFAKDSIFLALFLYMLLYQIPKIKKEMKEEMTAYRNHAVERMEFLENKVEETERKHEEVEKELRLLLKVFADKYDIVIERLDWLIARTKDNDNKKR